MITLAWWALGFLFAEFAPAFPAGNLAPLTRAITALWRWLDRPVRTPTPQGPKGSVQGPGMPPPAASGDTIYKRGLGEQSFWGLSVLWQCWLDIYLLSHRTKNRRFGLSRKPPSSVHFQSLRAAVGYLFLIRRPLEVRVGFILGHNVVY